MAKVITTDAQAFQAFTQATQHAQSRANAAEAERAATEAARLALPTQVAAVTGPAVAAAQAAANLAQQRAGVLGSAANDAALAGRAAGDYRVGTEIVSWSGSAITARTGVLASEADVQAARGVADTASNALGNLALTTLATRTQADGPQLADGSRWVWRASGTPAPGLVVAAGDGNGGSGGAAGYWHREYDGPIHTRWAIPDPAALTPAQTRTTLQALIDSLSSGEIVFDAVYTINTDGLVYPGMGNDLGLRARSNQTWRGPGGVRLGANILSNFAVVSNASPTINNFQLDGGFIVDVQGSTQTGWGATPAAARTNGVILFGPVGCRYGDVRVRDASASGLLMRGNGAEAEDNRITGADVDTCGYIGVQAQQIVGLRITDNNVRHTGDNLIDVEGDDPAGGFENPGEGHSVVITGNILRDGGCGVFLESTGRAIVSNNQMYDLKYQGVFMNRINSGSMDNIISDNVFRGISTAWEAVRFANNVGRTIVDNNRIDGFDHGITLAGGTTYALVRPNMHSNIRKTIINPTRTDLALIKSVVERQYYAGVRDANGFPRPFSPFMEPLEIPNRLFNAALTPVHDMETATEMNPNWYYKETATENNTAWAGGAGVTAIYFGGETIINIPANSPAVGDYLRISNAYYRVHAVNGNEITIRDNANAAGDYRAAVVTPGPVQVYAATVWTIMRTL